MLVSIGFLNHDAYYHVSVMENRCYYFWKKKKEREGHFSALLLFLGTTLIVHNSNWSTVFSLQTATTGIIDISH